jgi:hypothetical protein
MGGKFKAQMERKRHPALYKIFLDGRRTHKIRFS